MVVLQCPIPRGPYLEYCRGCQFGCQSKKLTCDQCVCRCQLKRGAPYYPRTSEVPTHLRHFFSGTGRWCMCRDVVLNMSQECQQGSPDIEATMRSSDGHSAAAKVSYTENALRCEFSG